jgi:hypothetical protein
MVIVDSSHPFSLYTFRSEASLSVRTALLVSDANLQLHGTIDLVEMVDRPFAGRRFLNFFDSCLIL